MLFYSTEKLTLEMGFGRPALDPNIFVGKLPRRLYPGSDWNLTLTGRRTARHLRKTYYAFENN